MALPPLPPGCGSWIVSRKDTGEVVGEFFSARTVGRIDQTRFNVESALDYLARINRK